VDPQPAHGPSAAQRTLAGGLQSTHSQYHGQAVSKLGEELDRFYLAHRCCGALTSAPHGDEAVWMACTCGATILVPAREEGTEPSLEQRLRSIGI